MDTSVSALLKKHGLKDTESRRLVVDALRRLRPAGSPYDIQKWIAKKGHTVNTVTVYRILEVLESVHLVHKHPCDGRFTLCSMPEAQGHHGFLHCTSCHQITEFFSAPLCKIENDIARKAKFKTSQHVSEIVGVCLSCQ